MMHDDDDFLSDTDSAGKKNETVQVLAPQTPEATPAPDYSADELAALVQLVHQLSLLFALQPADWSAQTDATIRRWLLTPDEPLLTVFYDGDTLTVCLDFPLAPVFDLSYFMREPGEAFTVATFNDRVTFGTVHEDIDGTMLAVLDKTFAPIFFSNRQLSENVRGQFGSALHSYLGYITGLHYKLSGITVLYVPAEGLRLGVEEAMADRDLVKRLETIAVQWIGAIRACLGDKEQLVPYELMCPPDQYDFYTYRFEVLRGLQLQMQHEDFIHIRTILQLSQSIFVKQLNDLQMELVAELERTNDNIDYLQLVVDPCRILEALQNPGDVPPKLKRIIHLIRVIWTEAKYFNTRELITGLFRCVSNQIIIFCQDKIDVAALLAGKPREGLRIANLTIDCCLAYRIIYDEAKKFHLSRHHPYGWDIDEAAIFNHVDAFVTRQQDFIEICNAMIVFGRIDETEDIPSPLFGGIRGKEFEKTCRLVEEKFQHGLVEVQNVSNHILDVHNIEWYDDVAKYRSLIRELEEIVENLITNVFVSVSNVEEGLEALCSLYYFSKRANLRQAYVRKTSEVWLQYCSEIETTNKQLLEQVSLRRAWVPKLAGRATSLKLNMDRITRLNDIFAKAEWLPDNTNSVRASAAYEQMRVNVTKNIRELYETWLDSMDADVSARLNRTLMTRSLTRPGMLECNIDRSVLELCEEARYFEMLGFGIPGHVGLIYSKYHTLKLVFETVVCVVLDYNKILGALSTQERSLFKALINNCERRVAPGLYKLTWGGEQIDMYIADCVKQTTQLQEFVDVYKMANERIVQSCERICDTPLIRLSVPMATGLPEFKLLVNAYRMAATQEVIKLYNGVVDTILVVYQGFEPQMDNMATEWLEYIRKLDALMQDALKLCARNSMLGFFNTLHGDGNLGPSPLLAVDIDLNGTAITFNPTMSEISEYLSSIGDMVLSSIGKIPRLFDSFNLPNRGNLAEFREIIADDEEFGRLQHAVADEISHNHMQLMEYVGMWTTFKAIWELDKEKFFGLFGAQTASAYDTNITVYEETAIQVSIQETTTIVYFMELSATNMKTSIMKHIECWKDGYKQLLKQRAYDQVTAIYDYTKERTKQMLVVPKTIVEMQKAIELMAEIEQELEAKHDEFPTVKHYFLILDKYEVIISSSYRQMNVNMDNQWLWYLDRIKEAEEMLDNCKDSFKLNLLAEAEELKDSARQLLEKMKELPTTQDTNPKDALASMRAMRAQLQALYDQEARMQADLGVFGINIPDNQDLRRLDRELAVLEEVWDLASQWEDAWEGFKSGSFWDIKVDDMEDVATTLYRRLNKLSKQLKDKNWDILERTKTAVDEFRKTLPLLVALKNPSMRPRHWDRVRDVCSVEFDEDDAEFNLEAIIKFNFQRFAEEIMDISYAATMELQIETGLKNIRELWATMGIEMLFFKEGIYRVKGVEECFTALEENAVQISTMKATRFVEPFSKEVDYWEKTLNYISECLENSLTVQRQWMYLENIFLGDDIRKQMPAETQTFEDLTEEWKEITTNMFLAKCALDATHYKPPMYLLEKLNRMSLQLELIERALELYLETKRQLFPRFYFISNDDMLEILGNAKKPDCIQQHMRKLFDNIYKIKLYRNTLAKIPKWESAGMISDDGEYVPFMDVLILNGPAEKWLNMVEVAMRLTLKDQLRNTRKSLKKMMSAREKWLALWPGQCCLTASKIQWTSDCTRNLTICKIVGMKKPLKKLRRKQNSVLMKLSDMSRKDLQKQMRLKVNTLITIEIHGRDVIDKMYKMNCTDVSHFEWFSQLRFYWDRDHDDCNIKQTNTANWYLYEYTGNSGRLVITPLTDRCYMTLTTALHLYRGGSPKGPAGTGKTETVKDLGKALGMWVIVNNCSDTLDFKSMAKCFSGLAQTGAWGCFDEFNRINIEVLSVVAQQINFILTALAQKKKRFMFEGYEINLLPTIGLFITMNPGYAGRTELPDNLKSMFRPISMMVPDNIIIAENLLFSDGFVQAKLLAKKVFTLYELAKQQLSKQHHYDFGLRSMVALLRYAGSKRRQFPNENEERIVYLAMKDMNIAKLTSDDFPLFNGIMSDIFPGVSIPNIDYEEFMTCIEKSLTEAGLQKIPAAITKTIQLYETKNSRHSVMLLGNTGTAKTVTWQVLKWAFGRMKALGKPGWVEVMEYPMNPKSLSGGELYGEYNLATGEWADGVLSAIMRKICNDESPDQKWMLFDGPVDAVWIENMNSVMDDNKVLTLVNSERITMPEQVSLLFEVADLAVASPATVSRCGMVYNDYKDWGWRPFIESWLAKQKSMAYIKILRDLFDSFFDKVLNFKRLHCIEMAPTNELNCIQSFCRLMNCLATKANGIDAESADLDNLELMTKMWFMFCMIWSICATVDENGRLRIDSYVREIEGMFPLRDTIYDYYVDVKMKALIPWDEQLSDSWRFSPDMPYYKIVVPTVDTVRYNFLVSKLIANEYPVLLTGPVGTGKSSTATSVLSQLDGHKYSMLMINMSAQTTSNNIQDTIEGRTEKRTKAVYVPIGGKTMICFMDDFNMPAKDTYGSQCALELVRQWIDYGFWYDRQKQWRIYVKQMLLVAAMGPAGGGRQVVSPRTVSRFNVINMTFPSEPTITRIFGTMLRQQLSEFEKDIQSLGKLITTATIDMYKIVSKKMLPTPAKMHYLFNLRDISKVFQGLLRCTKEYHVTKQLQLRLWIHECFRVFSDRLTDERDSEWFVEEVNNQLGRHFELTFHNLCPSKECPIFGDFISGLNYEDLADAVQLRRWMQNMLDDYNSSPGVVKMDLVLFKEAIEHVTRIIRVISQPRGNMLLVGIGGSGRQSLCRLSAYISDYFVFMIEVTKKYRTPEFREDLKTLYQMIGVENKPTVFLFNDTQLAEENFMEILNNMLSVGEVANLYKPDEFDEIKNSLEKAAAKAKIVPTTEAIFAFFMDRARSNLHICMCMSPIGNDFRVRIRQYPALVNCTTIDWFKEWPEVALLEVANKYLSACKLHVPIVTDEKPAERRDSLVMSTEERLRIAIAGTFAMIHTSVSQTSKQMLAELKRHNYVTPTNYLELVAGYQIMLNDKRAFVSGAANKLRNGLFKIEDTRIKVEGMSEELKVSQEQVLEFQAECDLFIIKIQKETEDADKAKQDVKEFALRIGEEEKEVIILAASANKDLQKAMPALNAAMQALDALNKKDLTEVKSYAKPPVKVEKVMESVMILLGKAATWTEAKRQLGEQSFLDQLKEFDKNHISDKTLKRIAHYTQDPELEPDKVGVVSAACRSLCLWVRAIEKYAKIYKVVGPKIELVEELEASLRLKQEQLAEAQRKLDELEAKLEILRREFQEKTEMKEALRLKAENLRLKLERAFMLVDGLAGERLRWIETVKRLDGEFTCLPGDCLIATAFSAYLGPFVSNYRDKLVIAWKKEIVARQIPASSEFYIYNFLADPTTIREWNIRGLPSDEFSTENGIIVTTGSRWPLIIDPQCQAMKWIKNKERINDLQIIDFVQPDYVKVLEMALQSGKPVLLQNVAEVLDPALSPILNKAIVRQGSLSMIKFNEKYVQYNENFRLFITTKMSNPHYTPEISTKTTLINFAVKETGLEAQLLGIVVRKERPAVEEQKDSLVVNIAKNKRTLLDLENEILRMLNESRGSILDDEELFRTLQISKQTSVTVKESLAIAEVTEVEIDMTREAYRPSANRASILFFVLMDMSRIDPMYQFSLDSYISLFSQSIDRSPKNAVVVERIAALNKFHTFAVYKNTCRGLFEMHKLLFSFHMCSRILANANKLNLVEFNFLLNGSVVLDRKDQMENPCPDWITDVSWDDITELDKLPGFHGVTDSIEKQPKEWHAWYTTTEPEQLPLVGEWQDICNDFQRMLFIRSLRPDRISSCVRSFIVSVLGPKFVEPPVLDVKAVLDESTAKSPLIFVLSTGVDPTSSLTQLAESSNMAKKFFCLSLGQGQAPIATKLIMEGVRKGQWVYLANCHLSLSWMPDLDKIVDTIQTKKPHSNFRLWLSSNPTPEFPISILQAGIKMTTEPPKGLKANLKRMYNVITEEQFSLCKAKDKYKKLLFSLCYFHAILLERKKFLQLGFNVAYSFNDADFDVSENLLSIYLDEYPETPWDALKYLIAGVNYGGHITDDWDRRLLSTYINQYFCETAIQQVQFKLSSLNTYYIPRDGNLESYQDYVQLLPNIDRPEAFGQHPNADIATLITDTRVMFETMLSLQMQSASAGGGSAEDKVTQLAGDIYSKIPAIINYENTSKLIGPNKRPLDVVLLQEIERYNVLLRNMKSGLVDLQRGIKGLVVMSAELEDIYNSMNESRVPQVWLAAYASLKPLGSWARDLVQRIQHFAQWAETIRPPTLFWLAAFTFPTGFLTAVLQTSARDNETPIDQLSWEFAVFVLEDANITEPPSSAVGGVYVRGTFLEGAGWNRAAQCLREPLPMELVCTMPAIHVRPIDGAKKRSRKIFACPCYYYPVRSGSFVIAVDLNSGTETADFWIKRGSALLLSLPN